MSLPQWLNGHFLISEVEMEDPNFYHAMILIISHDEDGAFGLIINRRSSVTLGQLLPDFSNYRVGKHAVYLGGPVKQQIIFALHSGLPDGVQSRNSCMPLPHVVFEPLVPELFDYLQTEWNDLGEGRRPPINFYIGHAGWGKQQLDEELQRKSWIVRPAAVKHIFHPNPQECWHDALEEMGGLYTLIAKTGFRPSLN